MQSGWKGGTRALRPGIAWILALGLGIPLAGCGDKEQKSAQQVPVAAPLTRAIPARAVPPLQAYPSPVPPAYPYGGYGGQQTFRGYPPRASYPSAPAYDPGDNPWSNNGGAYGGRPAPGGYGNTGRYPYGTTWNNQIPTGRYRPLDEKPKHLEDEKPASDTAVPGVAYPGYAPVYPWGAWGSPYAPLAGVPMYGWPMVW